MVDVENKRLDFDGVCAEHLVAETADIWVGRAKCEKEAYGRIVFTLRYRRQATEKMSVARVVLRRLNCVLPEGP